MNGKKGASVAAGIANAPYIEDRQMISQLFAEHHRRVLTAAYRITGNVADAEDVAQAVFLRLSNAIGVEVANPASFLYRAAVNGALDLLRRRKAAPRAPLEEASGAVAAGWGSSPYEEASGRELGARLTVAIGELPARAAEMFTLRYLEDWGNGEIAAAMGTSKAVVAVTLHQTRSRLQKRLTELEEEKR